MDLDAGRLLETVAKPHGFQVELILLEVHGLCPACQGSRLAID
jgi:Fe2+ or Zn2+ uptake regulation protein